MAKKAAAPRLTWREIIAGIKAGNFAPVYILMGEEPYYLDKIAETLEEKVVAPEDRDFNQLVLYGAETDVESVVRGAQQYPFMCDRRLVILKEAQAMDRAKTQLDKLEGYVSRPNTQTVLVIVYKGDSLSSTSKLMKAAAKSGAVVYNSKALKEHELSGPVADYCRAKGVTMDRGTIDLLTAFVGNSLTKLFSEIDKLIISAGPGCKVLTADMVRASTGLSKDFNNFELVNAICRRNYAQAMGIVDSFSSNPKANPVVVTIGILFRFFSQLCVAHFNADKSDQALMGVLELRNAYALRDIRDGMRMYNASQCVAIISAIREADCHSKGIESAQNEYAILRELIFRIFTV